MGPVFHLYPCGLGTFRFAKLVSFIALRFCSGAIHYHFVASSSGD